MDWWMNGANPISDLKILKEKSELTCKFKIFSFGIVTEQSYLSR